MTARKPDREGAVESNKKTLAALALMVIFALPGALAPAKSQATTVDPDYLVFQMGTENKDFETILPELKAEFGVKATGSSRYVGFGVALMTLKTPVDELRRQVTHALNSAEETGLPVLIKLDDMNFTTEYTDPSMVEWTAFPKPGETYGPLAKHYWLNWGSWMALPPTPNLESAAFRHDVEMRLKEGVLPSLLERLARWKDQNRSYLFAGMCVGWESGIPDYRTLRNAPVLPRDEQRKITMTEEERGVQFGYASLYARGWTQQKLQDTAAKTGKSMEDVTTEQLFQVIHDYTAFLAKTVHDAGIPKERIYTHGVAWESVSDGRLPGAWMRNSSRVPPIWVNVNDYSRPGYTVGAGQFDSEVLGKLLRAAGAQDGWGGVEAYVRGVESEDAFEGYLGQLFASGARLVDIFGWTAAGSPYDPKHAPGALLAVHSWLNGKKLPEASAQSGQQQTIPSGQVPQSLQGKMQRLQALVKEREQKGGNMQPIGEIMQGFQPLMQQQKFREAEALLDRALNLMDESPSQNVEQPAQKGTAQPPAGARATVDLKLPSYVHRLTYFGERPDWSHDGKRLIFVEKTFGDVFEIEVATGIIRPMTQHYFHNGYTRALFLANDDILLCGSREFSPEHPWVSRMETAELWVLDKALDKPPTPLGERCFEGPAVSRSRMRIAWTVHHENYPDQIPAGVYQFRIADIQYVDGRPMLMNKRGILDSNKVGVILMETQNFRPPLENELTFTGGFGANDADIMGLDLETGKIVNYTNTPGQYEEPEGIFPDGQYTTVETNRSEPERNVIDLWKVKLDGTNEGQRLTYFSANHSGFRATNPVVSDDGRFMAFQLARDGDPPGVGYGIFVYEFGAAKKHRGR